MINASATPVARVIREEDALVIVWEDGEEGFFPHNWLKENAPENRHFLTCGRQGGSEDADFSFSPWSVSIEYDETLVISWAGLREVNRFPLEELRAAQPIIESPELALAAD